MLMRILSGMGLERIITGINEDVKGIIVIIMLIMGVIVIIVIDAVLMVIIIRLRRQGS
jgi:heme/copper-type cytochrome/quinol oxidase subunit 2